MTPENKYAFDKALNFFQIPLPEDISEIKKQYRYLALKYHPDHSDDRSGSLFRLLNDHYNILIDNYSNYYKEFPPPKPKKEFKGTRIFRVLDNKIDHHCISIPDDFLLHDDGVLFIMWQMREFIVHIPQDLDLSSTIRVDKLVLTFKKEVTY